MTPPLESNEIKKRMNDYKEFIEHTLKIWDRLPQEKVPINYFGLAIDARSVAIYSLMLGDRVEALEWFKKSSDYFCRSVIAYRSISGVSTYQEPSCIDALYMAVLSSDSSLINESVKLSLAIADIHPKRSYDVINFYYYCLALASFLAGEREKTIKNLDNINPSKYKRLGNYFTGLSTTLRGLVEDDKSKMLEGISMILKYYSRAFRGSKSPHEIISIEATAFIKMAREKGVLIKQEDISKGLERYIPWNLLD